MYQLPVCLAYVCVCRSVLEAFDAAASASVGHDEAFLVILRVQ